MQKLNIRPVTDLRNSFSTIESEMQSGPIVFTKNGYGTAVMMTIGEYERLLDPMEAILAETDRIAQSDPRRFTRDEVYARLKGRVRHV